MDPKRSRPPALRSFTRRSSVHPELPDESPARLSVTVTPDGDVTLVGLAGELELSTVAALESVVDQVVGAEPGVVLVDLYDVTFCDARGPAGLLALQQRLAAAGRRPTLTGARPTLRRLIEVARLDGVLRVG